MDRATTQLTCPKCGGDMRTYVRNGITIDQCRSCHGIFLDRGELERLMSAESAYLGGRDQHEGGEGFLGELFD